MLRTHLCAELWEEHIGIDVVVCGWCNTYRDHGGVIFLDLRDHSGIIQLVCDPSSSAYEQANLVRDEFVLIAKGKVRARGAGLENPKLHDTSRAIDTAIKAIRILISEDRNRA